MQTSDQERRELLLRKLQMQGVQPDVANLLADMDERLRNVERPEESAPAKTKAVQIAIAHVRGESEQYGSEKLVVLLDDGRIFRRDAAAGGDYYWSEVTGSWL